MGQIILADDICIQRFRLTAILTLTLTSLLVLIRLFRQQCHSIVRTLVPVSMTEISIDWRKSIEIHVAKEIIEILHHFSRSDLESTSMSRDFRVSFNLKEKKNISKNKLIYFFSDAFNRQFMPYRMGENISPTHSPPIGVTPSTSQVSTSQTQPAYSIIRPQPQLPQNAAISAMVAACVANGQITNGNTTAAQTLLHHHLNQQQSTQISPLRIRINSPTRINSTSSSQSSSDHVITTTSSSPPVPGVTTLLPQKHPLHLLNGGHLARISQLSQLHRPFESPSPTPPAPQARASAKEATS